MSDRNQTSAADPLPGDDAPPIRPPTTDSAPTLDPLETQALPTDVLTDDRTVDASTLTRNPLDTYAPRGNDPSSTSRDHASPNGFPGYEVLDRLGEGGMGIVYRARQVGLNRIVALKVVLGGRRDDPKDLIRFLAEAEAVASIQHPHVVHVHEYGEADGRPYLAMEYLPGGTLAERLKAGKLEPRAAAELVAKLARGVQAAHDREIVHRDLKPGNILFDDRGEPRVADFGLAKRAKGSDQTRTQAVMGTPAYMSPEQAEGKSKFVGPAADVYALGVVLYECLTGSRPFDHDDHHVLLHRVMMEEPEPPSRRVPGLHRDLALIDLKCLAKDPADRYPTARAFAEDLTRFVVGEPVTVRAAGAIERALKWARRKPTLAATYALTATVVLLLAFGVSLAILWRLTERARAAAVVAKSDAEKAERSEREARTKLARVEYGRTMQVAYQELRDNNFAATLALLEGTHADLRGWEWKYVYHLCHGELLELKGHTRMVSSVSWSPDGSRLATAGWDHTARVWDARSGAEALALKGHLDVVFSVSWSPDGSRLATAYWDQTARVWDARSGAEALALKGHTGEVRSVSWSQDGTRLATASDDGTARVWDARSAFDR